MTQKRKHYSKKFKIDAVKRVSEQGFNVSEAEYQDLVISALFIMKCDINLCFRQRNDKNRFSHSAKHFLGGAP